LASSSNGRIALADEQGRQEIDPALQLLLAGGEGAIRGRIVVVVEDGIVRNHDDTRRRFLGGSMIHHSTAVQTVRSVITLSEIRHFRAQRGILAVLIERLSAGGRQGFLAFARNDKSARNDGYCGFRRD
jgi:hypothetical protein